MSLLGAESPLPVTYAGGVRDLADAQRVRALGGGRVDVSIGSALDIFGGSLAYADVLRKAPTMTDAAFNYEYVVKLRDRVAKAPARRGPPPKAAPLEESVDLPIGPTLHGNPGGPPDETPMGDFKTVTPMRYDEREEQMDPGRGQKLQRKG